ncbi:uncharacterized protein M6B38_348025 [Iris pallida]|uniref:DUF309 domain-containing protein n=1 Tax=Iris pallida TaxID=29817 RepID=A0AAX6DTE1_IRIPA|nr:uncharacterized protein M6B38_228935 [Iris pallida]KAJ6831702.1 uncharacterized protein M6B38_348025 [Iris pallida]
MASSALGFALPTLRPPRPSVRRPVPPLLPSRPSVRPLPTAARYRLSSSESCPDIPPPDEEDATFGLAVSLFNGGDYHRCHDVLEEMWSAAEEPARTLLHGILQCAVGLHHLFNQNHRGAMMELGEGLCKLRKMDFESGPFFRFEKEVSHVLEFLYQTQMELAACTDDICLAMDGSERSYQLLGSFAAGQRLYNLDIGADNVPCITFCPSHHYASEKPTRVRVPTLHATEENLNACEYQF